MKSIILPGMVFLSIENLLANIFFFLNIYLLKKYLNKRTYCLQEKKNLLRSYRRLANCANFNTNFKTQKSDLRFIYILFEELQNDIIQKNKFILKFKNLRTYATYIA